jgi:DNA repair ATPase RecN
VPKITGDLATVLRETKKLSEVAASLKEAQKGLDAAAGKWPELQKSLKQTAKVLHSSAEQLDRVVAHRDDYEASVKQSTELAETFALMVPLLTDQLDSNLAEQEKSLRDLESSLNDVGNSVPTFKRGALDLLTTGRLLLWLTAAAVGLHGGLLLAENRRKKASP